MEFEGSFVSRSQPCAGLLGLCLNQPIDLAKAAFGGAEAAGFPQAVTPNEYDGRTTACHRWELPELGVDVCEAEGAMTRIGLYFSEGQEFALSLPNGVTARFPNSATELAEELTTAHEKEPFSSSLLQGEGESVISMQWFFPTVAEGPDEEEIIIVARSSLFLDQLPEPCEPGGLDYPYEDVLAVAANYAVTQIEVSEVPPADVGKAPCSRTA